MSASRLRVEVVYALPETQTVLSCELAPGSTVRYAIEHSGLLAIHPTLNIEEARLGIFGQFCDLNDPVHDGDRVEIYRPLVADPKEARRRRAEVKRKVKRRS